MNENKINPLLDAMSEIDDNIITNTKKRPKKLPIVIAAAAALMLLTGATVIYNRYPGSMTINEKPMFEYNYAIMKDVTPLSREEMLAMGAEITKDRIGFTIYNITALPSEMFKALNMPSRINDNFIEEETEIEVWYSFDTPEEIRSITLLFSLVDKNNGKSVKFYIDCTRSEEYVLGGLGIISLHDVDGKTHYEDFDKELLTLNDGSQALVYKWGPDEEWYATFAYDGLVYTDVSVNSSDYDDIIQVLNDLGVL